MCDGTMKMWRQYYNSYGDKLFNYLYSSKELAVDCREIFVKTGQPKGAH